MRDLRVAFVMTLWEGQDFTVEEGIGVGTPIVPPPAIGVKSGNGFYIGRACSPAYETLRGDHRGFLLIAVAFAPCRSRLRRSRWATSLVRS